MTATLSDLERRILLALAGDLLAASKEAARLRRVPSSALAGDFDRRIRDARRLAELDAAIRWGPRVDLARWLGTEATPAVRQAGCRALARLAAAGLIERSAPAGGRLTHAKLTEAGRGIIAEVLAATGEGRRC